MNTQRLYTKQWKVYSVNITTDLLKKRRFIPFITVFFQFQ